MAWDLQLVQELGWEEFVKHRRPRGDLTSLDNVEHTARHILKQYQDRGVPVHFCTGP